VVYAAEQDTLCYPGTTVLINLAGITDQPTLDEFEFAMYLTRADEPFPHGDLGYAHYRQIHRHLFQDVYDWAGQPRTIRIAKGGNWFCYPEYLQAEMSRVFDRGRIAVLTNTSDTPTFCKLAAELLADINAGHPFRDGNGRTQLTFLALLAATAGRGFDAGKLEPERVMQAMIDSFAGRLDGLTELIKDLTA